MTNSKELFRELVDKIRLNESKDEIESIVYLILENQLGLGRTDVLARKKLESGDPRRLDEIISRVNNEEPIQYILGEASFFGRTFHVDPSVLIPRVETEELIREALRQFTPGIPGMIVVDIGTGSGCLAVTLAKELPEARVIATEISAAALVTAVGNAKRNGADVQFIRNDILVSPLDLKEVTLVVSNPPYVTQSEIPQMANNVTAYEPALALFVTDDDPLGFYKAIARQAKRILKKQGGLIVEINERFGREVCDVFSSEGFQSIKLLKDLAGKDRIVSSRI